jgi:hypothetical protein
MHAAIMFATLRTIMVASTQDLPAPNPPEFTHSDQIAGYASAVAGVTRAEKLCPGYRPNPSIGRIEKMDGHPRQRQARNCLVR